MLLRFILALSLLITANADYDIEYSDTNRIFYTGSGWDYHSDPNAGICGPIN